MVTEATVEQQIAELQVSVYLLVYIYIYIERDR